MNKEIRRTGWGENRKGALGNIWEKKKEAVNGSAEGKV